MTAHLDIIIPVYNEAENLVPLLERLHGALTAARIVYHVYVVDDHSTDGTVDVLQAVKKKFHLTILTKQGKQGKAYSILEAARIATAPYIVMIDADLQYPPEVIPDMYRLAQQYGVVVARRKTSHESFLRHIASRSFMWVFGKLLHGLDCDVQSGLKLFRKDIIDEVDAKDVSPWTLDIPLLTTALNLGFKIGEVDITFADRRSGESKIKLLESIQEIGGKAITYKLKRKDPFRIQPHEKNGMLGAGLIQRGHRFVTHTTLLPSLSALDVLTRPQKFLVGIMLGALAVSFFESPLVAAGVLVGVLSTIYFIDMIFNLYVIMQSLQQPPEITISPSELAQLNEKKLPLYTVMCPLYREAHVLPSFLAAIEKLDWPKQKLDVILLLEEDDQPTIEAARAMTLPPYVSIRVVPDSQPKTKPKACNYGLHFAKGEFLVIYDAEDIPDPLQLKKVYAAFQKVADNVKCIQAKLNFYNPHQNLLTRFFTAEYSLWFDVILTGLQSIQTSLPLGGTSNHFRTQELRALEGWDPFNVTEDADLGIRLFKRGALTAIIDSVTLEEANSSWGNWLRQRSRWIKGYMQTYLVHMRHPYTFFKEYGLHALLFQLVMGGKIAFMLINPFMWLLTLTYFGLYAWVGPTIEALYPSYIFYMAVSSLLFGNFMFVYFYMIGAAKREHWTIIKWALLVPVYWLMVSVAAVIALYQLIVKPHYWEKTIHGLHLKKEKIEQKTKAVVQTVSEATVAENESLPQPNFLLGAFVQEKLRAWRNPTVLAGASLLLATLGANVLNMATNFYLGKSLNFHDFGIFNLMMSIFYLSSIPIQALSSTINYQGSYLLGKHRLASLPHFWKYIHNRVLLLSIPITILWLVVTPLMPVIFHVDDWLPFVLFAYVWIINLSFAVNSSYLSARLLFFQVAILVFLQAAVRLAGAVVLSHFVPSMTFLAVIVGLYVPGVLAYFFAKKGKETYNARHEFHLPRDFFLASLIAGLSTIAFFSLDNLLIAHLMRPEVVGQYAFLGLFGKMVFFIGSITATFLAPIVARKEGQGQDTTQTFRLLFGSVVVMTVIGFITFILGPYFWGQLVFGDKVAIIKDFLIPYGIGIGAFTLSQMVTNYHLLKKHYLFPLTTVGLAGVQVIALFLFHGDLRSVVTVMMGLGVTHLFIQAALHFFYPVLRVPLTNVQDFLDLFRKTPRGNSQQDRTGSLRILIFNWRDTKHVWAGGAEVYIHNVAQRLVEKGHRVTLFCGNDGKSPRNEVVDGVQVIRRGGFYTVYFWAFIYYVLRLRKFVDVVIDCENGIPFLTPLFVGKPIVLLIYHIHRDVFIEHLILPLSLLARSIEELIMPLIYRERPIITISDSSKKEIMSLGISHPEKITIAHPGVKMPENIKVAKTQHPSVCYVGRLKPYKNVDTLIHAFSAVLKSFPSAKLSIAGFGESEKTLRALVTKLRLEKQVVFLGKISENEKARLYASQWLAVQPSMVEGWGITVIEANACGTPVVASDVNGLRDSTKNFETGILVKSQNVSAFTEAIEGLLKNDSERKAYSKRALVWAKNFDWDKSSMIFEKILLDECKAKTDYEVNKNYVQA